MARPKPAALLRRKSYNQGLFDPLPAAIWLSHALGMAFTAQNAPCVARHDRTEFKK
jgi:hypothetical protein